MTPQVANPYQPDLDEPIDWNALLKRRLSVPTASQPGASWSEGAFQVNPFRETQGWGSSPVPGSMVPDSSGVSGLGTSGQPSTEPSKGDVSAGAARALKMTPPTSSTPTPTPEAPPTRQAPPLGYADKIAALQGQQAQLATPVGQQTASGDPGQRPVLQSKGVGGALQRIAMAVLSATKLAPYANQIVHPLWSQQMAENQAQQQALTGQIGELEKAGQAREAEQRGAWYQAQAEGARQKPILMKDGSIFDPRTGQIVQAAPTPLERKQQALELGLDEDAANAYALGLKPEDVSKNTQVLHAGLPANIQALYTPDAKGMVRVPTSLIEKGLTPTGGEDQPLGPDRVKQFNQLLAQRYAVLHPNTTVLPAYQLPANATVRDYQNVEHSLGGEETAAGALASQAATRELRQQTFALAQQAQADREAQRGQTEDQKQKEIASKIYTPLLNSAKRFNIMAQNYEDAVKNGDQQAMLSLLTNHIGMTLGEQKGARITKDIIHEAIESRPWLQGLESKVNFDKGGLLSGVTLTPPQMREMVGNAQGRFQEEMRSAQSAANYMGIKDGGPSRAPNQAVVNYYFFKAGRDPAAAKKLMAQDGWSVQ